MNARRLRRREGGDPDRLASLPPLLARLYAARGVRSPAEAEYRLSHLPDPWALRGMRAAVDRLDRALQRGDRVLIVGDYDADGATSTALALRGLGAMGFERLDYRIPSRFDDGYGLSPGLVDRIAQAARPDLIVTVDNGISSVAAVERARAAHSIDVIVTDHHLPGSELPAATAIVNPNQPGDDFPGKSLAGVGVLFFVLIALRQHLRNTGWFTRTGRDEPNLAIWLDLVALGTVADVVPLDHLNRTLVEQGLRRIRSGKACPGITALLRAGDRDPARVRASDMGFVVGPRLNAAGRLDDMSIGIECLRSDDPDQAGRQAAMLDRLNRDRRAIENEMQQQALQLCDRLSLSASSLPWGLALYHEDWHQGVVGLVASRLKERHHRPVIAFAAGEDGLLKGSGRSIPGLHIRDALERIDSRHPGMIAKFGGHAMAAGLSLPAERLAEFRQAFDAAVREMLPADALAPVVLSDGSLPPSALGIDTARLLQRAGPWGQGFPEPVFDGRFRVLHRQTMKDRHLRYSLRPDGSDLTVTAVAFNVDPAQWPGEGQSLHIAYRLDVNHFQGLENPQLTIVCPIDEDSDDAPLASGFDSVPPGASR